MDNQKKISRRTALKYLGYGALGVAALNIGLSCAGKGSLKSAKLSYRKDNARKEKISMLGFGCMRFPMIKDAEGKNVVDFEKTSEMVHYAYDNGVNYFDTAYTYLNSQSEKVLGQIMKDFPRESVNIVTKMPTWLVTDLDKGKALFQEQLDNLQVEYFDFYLLHALSSGDEFDKAYKETGVLDYLKEEKAKGRIRRLGFSFHGNEAAMDYLLPQYDWDFVQLQINYLDWEAQNAKYMYEECAKRNIQVVAMEPLRGGVLAKLNKEAVDILHEADPNSTPAAWAFRYLASLPNMLTILSGMTELKYVEENVRTFTDIKPLTEQEREVLARALEAYKKITPVPCTGCAYCMPCNFGVEIPAVFAAYNDMVAAGQVPDLNGPRDAAFEQKKQNFLAYFNQKIGPDIHPDRCTRCGACKSRCPQEIDIPAELAKINNLLRQIAD